MTAAKRPLCRAIGCLPPDAGLLLRIQDADYQRDDFCEGAQPPEALLKLLAAANLAPIEPRGMLLTSSCSVPYHVDEYLSAAWLIRGNAHIHQLIVAGESVDLKVGDVVEFNAKRKHAFLANEPGEWSLFSIYVRRIKSASPSH